ncbi:hypothetical protein [Bacillus sp. V3B]|uniref:hypothetical protein n=1 Tax=Bacillus sp. V3B TaxID=2804915 RepID=UPI002109FE71|nr:hypothetical protein [Bacillus sp. V3B]
MNRWIRSNATEITGFAFLGAIMLWVFGGSEFIKVMDGSSLTISPSILSMNTIFLSILIEALPLWLLEMILRSHCYV